MEARNYVIGQFQIKRTKPVDFERQADLSSCACWVYLLEEGVVLIGGGEGEGAGFASH